MPNQDSKGQFQKGNTMGKGRPKGSVGIPKLLRQQGYDFIAQIFENLFIKSEKELIEYINENKSNMSRAEKVFLEKSKNIIDLNHLLDRVVGKATVVEIKTTEEGLPMRVFAFPDPKKVIDE